MGVWLHDVWSGSNSATASVIQYLVCVGVWVYGCMGVWLHDVWSGSNSATASVI